MLRRIVGGDVPEGIRPLLIVQFLRTLAGSSMFTFLGLWGLRRLDASESELSVAFLVAAAGAMLASYAGGRLSDTIGRRPPILVGAMVDVVAPLAAIAVGTNVYAGFATMIALWTLGSLGDAANQAIVADLTEPERLDDAYAALRVAANSGAIAGPAIGAALLGVGWNMLFAGTAVLGTAAFVVAIVKIPHVHGKPREAGAGAPWRVIVADRKFLVLIAAGVCAWIVYLAYDYLMPISLVQNHGLQQNLWGFLVIANPIAVTIFQLRVTARTGNVRPVVRLVAAMALMGLPFLLLGVSDGFAMILVILVVFVFGEMLWVPAMQTAIAARAPEDLRGAYMGAAGSAPTTAFALTPLIGLQVLDRFGDQAMWGMVAGVALVGAVLFTVAVQDQPQVQRSITTA